MALARCPKCEAIINSNDEYCRYCGCKIKEEPKDAKVDSFSAENSASKKENITSSSTSFTNKKPSTSSSWSSKALASTNKSYRPHENKRPYGYDEKKLKNARTRYILGFVIALLVAFSGACLIWLALRFRDNGKIPGDPMLLGLILLSVILFIVFLILLVKSYSDPVGTCLEESDAEEVDGDFIADCAVDLLHIITNK